MFRQEEDVGGLLKETGQCVKGEWKREGGGVQEGGLAPLCVSRLRAFLEPSSGARVPFVC